MHGEHDPLVNVFAPDNQTKLRKAIANKQDFGLLVRIAPESTLAAVPPRVKGDMTVDTTVEHGPQGATRTTWWSLMSGRPGVSTARPTCRPILTPF